MYNGLPVTSIADRAFKECTSITSVVIPNTITSIGINAFYKTSITSINIPKSVTSIGQAAFNNCVSLKAITLPDLLVEIEAETFSGCTSLESIVIPDSVTYIGSKALEYCKSLKKINFQGTKEQWNEIDKSFLWEYPSGSYVVYCSNGIVAK